MSEQRFLDRLRKGRVVLGDDAEALRHYESLRGWDTDRNELTLRRERIARIHERNGRNAEARAALEQLLLLWKDADPDLPALADARARLTRLQ
jgi:hypothetical protein